jgi:three-Cys-motif partner protein
MSLHPFFDESSEQSRVKSAIVAKYFDAWSRVIVATQTRDARQTPIAYIDLFCGPGRYGDGTPATPVLILESAIRRPEVGARLISIFCDKDERNIASLRQVVEDLPGIGSLAHPPRISVSEAGDDVARMFGEMRLVPTLLFADPWGYKGLSLELIDSVVKDWACECIFFFNYNRINPGLGNDAVERHIDRLFGKARADALRTRITSMAPDEREQEILSELVGALKELHGKFVLPFAFRSDEGTRTSHYLIFVSKSFKGYEIMRDVMASQSSSSHQGVASFEYNPARVHRPLLIDVDSPLDDLVAVLQTDFAGRTLTMRQLYEEHSVGRPYTRSNYGKALLELERAGRILVGEHRRNSFKDDLVVTFPGR